MNKQTNSKNVLLSIINDEYPGLTENEGRALAEIVSKYLELLEESRIEEVVDYLYANYDILVKLL